MKIPVLNNFCCCGSLRTGAITIGILAILGDIFSIVTFWHFNTIYYTNNSSGTYQHEEAFHSGYITTICSLTIGLTINFCLLFGIFKKNHLFMLPWLVYQFLSIAGIALVFVIFIIFSLVVVIYKTIEGIYILIGFLVLLFILIVFSISVYFWMVCYSYFAAVKLEKNRNNPIIYRNLEGNQDKY